MACASARRGIRRATGTEPIIDDAESTAHPDAIALDTQTLLDRYEERLARNPNTNLKGYVTTIGGAPLEGVTIRAGERSAVTDASGAYTLKGVALGGYAVSFDHPDYVFAQRRITLESTDSGWLTQMLLPRSQRWHIDADRVAIVQEGPLTLEFEPGDLVVERDQSVVTAIDPRVPGHLFAAPAELEGAASCLTGVAPVASLLRCTGDGSRQAFLLAQMRKCVEHRRVAVLRLPARHRSTPATCSLHQAASSRSG